MSTDVLQFTEWTCAALTEAERRTANALLREHGRHAHRNALRSRYYDSHNKLRDLGIAIPPPLRNVETVVGWPAKAVDKLAVRSMLDGFTFSGDGGGRLAALLADNDFGLMYRQLVTSELTHACAFATVSRGGADEPPVVISAYSARQAAALWDYRRKRIKAGICVVDGVGDGPDFRPTWLNLYTDDQVALIRRSGNGRWRVERVPHSQGMPLMVPFRNAPSIDRPLGKSRISRAVMSITDSAVREALRSEVVAEFAAAPQKWIMGAPDDIFKDNAKWEAFIGNFLALSADEDGNRATVGQFPQLSMQPHTEVFRTLAARFSGETSIPMSSLGIIHDNPASAEAIYAAKEDLVIEAGYLNDVNATSLRTLAMLAMAIDRGVPVARLTDDEKSVMPHFKNPALPSIVSQSDAVVKIASALPWFGETSVALEELGFTEEQRARMLSERRRTGAIEALNALAAQRGAAPPALGSGGLQ